MARILAISSHVVRGHVGLAASVPALQWLGHEVWALPTVILASGLLVVLAVQYLVTNPELQTRLFHIEQPLKIEFMWFNLIGFAVVMGVGWLLSLFAPRLPPAPADAAPSAAAR